MVHGPWSTVHKILDARYKIHDAGYMLSNGTDEGIIHRKDAEGTKNK